MLTANVSLLLAFAAGMLSFAAPCVPPLVPAYLGYLSDQPVRGENQTATP
jgi:cytochrome c-type biogenesis protein